MSVSARRIIGVVLLGVSFVFGAYLGRRSVKPQVITKTVEVAGKETVVYKEGKERVVYRTKVVTRQKDGTTVTKVEEKIDTKVKPETKETTSFEERSADRQEFSATTLPSWGLELKTYPTFGLPRSWTYGLVVSRRLVGPVWLSAGISSPADKLRLQPEVGLRVEF